MSWQNSYAKGAVSPAAVLRLPAGTICIYECKDQKGCHRLQNLVSGNSRGPWGTGAKFHSSMLYAFNTAGKPYYLVRVEVLKQGKPKQKTGRKTK